MKLLNLTKKYFCRVFWKPILCTFISFSFANFSKKIQTSFNLHILYASLWIAIIKKLLLHAFKSSNSPPRQIILRILHIDPLAKNQALKSPFRQYLEKLWPVPPHTIEIVEKYNVRKLILKNDSKCSIDHMITMEVTSF